MHPDLDQIPQLRPNKPGIVRLARPIDLPFIEHLARSNTEEVGFLPKQAIGEYIDRRAVMLAMENGDPAGYLLGKHHVPDYPGTTMIHQACVCFDARRRALGLSLVKRYTTAAAVSGNGAVQLWCRGNLDANEFWKAAGFEAMALRPGGERRGIPHILWRIAVVRHALLSIPPSTRRRGRSGTAVMRPSTCTTDQILEFAKNGDLSDLLEEWRSRDSSAPADYPNAALPADYDDPADLTPSPPSSEALPADYTSTPLRSRLALTSRLRTPPSM